MDVRGERRRAIEDMAGVAAGGIDSVDRGAVGRGKGEVEVGRRVALDQEQVERGIIAEALGRAIDLLGIAERRQGIGIEGQALGQAGGADLDMVDHDILLRPGR
jgi:hypothetical protein